jgi:mono/diheme cytochrome c family protein
MLCPRPGPLLLLLLGLTAPLLAQASDRAPIDAPALFAANCAKCHGLDGSGTGPAVLDRPARNFKEGGFSFGNTPEVIARTIAHGIPGSPMPAFEGALTDEQLRALAGLVVTLGPPVKEVSEAETMLHVTDEPLIVRGILPPLEEGGPRLPRGLLIGTPDGLSFQYAADDVRLLAVRQGDFVKRSDWGDRGGSPLEPLGKVVWKAETTDGRWFAEPAEDGVAAPGDALKARLLSTGGPGQATLSYALLEPDASGAAPRTRAIVVETLERPEQRLSAHSAAGQRGMPQAISRHFSLAPVGKPSASPRSLVLALGAGFAPPSDGTTTTLDTPAGPRTFSWWTRGLGTASVENRLITAPLRADGKPSISIENDERGLFVRVLLDQGPTSFTVDTSVIDGSTLSGVPPEGRR